MASPDPVNVRQIPARVCHSPTDLSTPFPHGGTALGNVRAIVFRPNIKVRTITAQEFGGAVVEAIAGGGAAVLALALRDFDADALALLFGAAAGPAGGTLVTDDVTGDSARAGRLLSTRAKKLFVSPLAIDQDPGLYLPLAIPCVERTAALAWSWAEEYSTPALFLAVPDATGRTWRHALRGDITL